MEPNVLLWIIAGIVLIILEMTALPGVGMLFAGVAAVLVAILAENFGINLTYQWVVFLAATIILTLLFYKPLRRWQTNKDAKYSDTVGESAVVIGNLQPGVEGKVRYSGTIMKAKLQSANALAEGRTVKIIAIDGNILIVTEE